MRVPVEDLKDRITFSEFLEWLAFLDLEEERHSKLDIYLAQLTAEVRRSYVESPKKVKVESFLIKQETKTESPEEKMRKSKSAWFALLKPETGK